MRVHLPFDRQCELAGLPVPEAEYQFAKVVGRKWRADFAWPSHLVLLEVQGGAFVQGRHSRGMGQVKDFEKLNAAAELGYRVLQVIPKQVANGEALMLVDRVLRKAVA